MTDSYIEESGKLSPSSIIELFELELVEGLHYATGNPDNVITTYRWHAGTNSRLNESVKFNGQVYTPMPIEAEGFDYKSGKNDSLARPTLRISNLLSTISTILIEVNKITAGNDLLNAKVTRKRTFAMFLDSDNFGNVGTTTYTVTVVQNSESQNVFAINGTQTPTLTLTRGHNYIFDQSHISNEGHPLLIRQTDDNPFTTGVSTFGTIAQTGAYTYFSVPTTAPNSLKYYCSNHGNVMGNTITVNSYVNPNANPNATSRDEVYFIDRKSTENRSLVEFELAQSWDLPNFKLPKRQVLPRQFPGVGSFHE